MRSSVCLQTHHRVNTAERAAHDEFPIPPRWRILVPLHWAYWAAVGQPAAMQRAEQEATAALQALEAQPMHGTGVIICRPSM